MKDITTFIVSSVLLIIASYEGYFVWFKPKKYLEALKKRKVRLKSQFSFLPDWLIDYFYFYDQPVVSVWGARVVITFIMAICIFGLIVSIHGPFQGMVLFK